MEHIFATWCMVYIAAQKHEGCIFCDFPAERRDTERYILHPTQIGRASCRERV